MRPVSVPSPRPERGLTTTQRRALLTLATAVEMETAALAHAAGLKTNGAALALRGLERRGLVSRDEGEPEAWKVTFVGHGLAARLRDGAAAEGDGREGRDGSAEGGRGDGRDGSAPDAPAEPTAPSSRPDSPADAAGGG